MYQYDPEFYRYIGEGAAESARQVLPRVLAVLPGPVHSVLDVGCGAGAWLSVWKELGASVRGIDGDYVIPDMLMIDPSEFMAADLSQAFHLGERFDLAQCLEVAEHLPTTSAAILTKSLCGHADIVLFSAAPPGQGGENHINEQPYSYWRDHFAAHGFVMYDPLRETLLDNETVKPWYRYNSFLFVGEQAPAAVHSALSDWRVDPTMEPRDLSPWLYRLRKRLVALLPASGMTRIAMWKKSLFNTLKTDKPAT